MKLFVAVLTVLVGGVGLERSVYAADPATGRTLARQCQTCHGLDGIAQIPIAPNLAGESRIYIETQLKAFRSGKREHEIMSVVSKGLSDEDISNLAAWYESIQVTATMPETP
ncbi:c-type cytochrome [Modicisalibacter luteus]|jgi:cytochrome c553|uniref:C-type cytochrome n=1 Tax=Modicisalibacter luteus TaxID=453962 RepID=A0ABV7M4Q8_9GAMM|nr:cytochrome c [Halomonas lutea]GHA89950.1 cytochrome c554 [Halomonas lutea]